MKKTLFTLWLCLLVCGASVGCVPEAPASSSADHDQAGAEDLRNRSLTAFEEGDHARAIELATELIREQPDSAGGYYLRGMVLGTGLQDYERAVADLAEVNRLAPDFAGAWNKRGWYLILLGRWDEAREVAAKGQALAPDDYASNVNLGHTYLLTRRSRNQKGRNSYRYR